MGLPSTGGDPSLEVMKRHMRRISQPCGLEMQRDALLAKDDLLKVRQSLPRSGVSNAVQEETRIGDAQVAPKKEKGKKKKDKSRLPPAPSATRATSDQVNPRTGYRSRRNGCSSEFHLLPHCPGEQPNAA